MIFQYSSEPFKFEVQALPNKMVRIFYYLHDELKYCRQEKAKIVLQFLTNSEDAILFKGRIRLEKLSKKLIVHGHKISFVMLDTKPLIAALQQYLTTK